MTVEPRVRFLQASILSFQVFHASHLVDAEAPWGLTSPLFSAP